MQTSGFVQKTVPKGEWKLHERTEYSALSFSYVEDCLRELIPEEDQVDFVMDYLRDHPEITHWVAIDDLNMGIDIVYTDGKEDQRYWGLTNFVWTPQESEGIKQSGKKEKILEFLK